jgi:hypothetical protein
MRSLLILVVVLFPFDAWAFDGQKAAQEFDVAFGLCRMGQTADGKALTTPEWDRVCKTRDTLTAELKAHNWCWNKSEQEWAVCK